VLTVLSDILDRIAAAAPVEGLEQRPDGTLVPQYRTEPTAEQRRQVESILATADLRDRRPRPTNDLLTAIQALSATDRNRLIALAIADLLQRHPRIARKLNIDLEGDEVIS
jgi:hypothetical protein